MQASPQIQLDFIAYLQRIFVEGDFSATYKYALLHALADICVEHTGLTNTVSANNGSTLRISHQQLAEKFIELYWQHSVPYSATAAEPMLLLQNMGQQAKILTQLAELRACGVNSVSQLKRHHDWSTLVKASKNIVKVGPLWRLQKLAGIDECFLYPHQHNTDYIELNSGISFCFRRFYDLVVTMVRNHWQLQIRKNSRNDALIGDKGNLADFLFGSNRRSLQQAKPLLFDIQAGNCFYCQKPLKLQQDTAEVDHFIPWTRYPNDLGHNFVLAHRRCNNNKRDHLASLSHQQRWLTQNLGDYRQRISDELSPYFSCDIERTLSINHWAYQVAKQNHSQLWQGINQFVGFDETSELV